MRTGLESVGGVAARGDLKSSLKRGARQNLDEIFKMKLPIKRKVTEKKISQKQSPEVFCKKSVLRNFTKFTGKHLCQSLLFIKVAGLSLQFYQKETLAQVFFCQFCKISKNTFSYRTSPVASSD